MNDSRLIPKPLIHIHEEYPEHQWRRKENGEIDDLQWNLATTMARYANDADIVSANTANRMDMIKGRV